MTDSQRPRWMGQPVRRREDERFLRGAARYVADLDRPHCLHAVFVRSPHGHARVRRIDADAARQLSGVVGVWTGRDLAPHIRPVPHPFEDVAPDLARFVRLETRVTPMPVLAVDRVRFQGEAVAVVVANDPYVAEDARDLVVVDYEQMPAVTDPEAALAPDAVQLHPDCPGNLAVRLEVKMGDPEQAMAGAAVVVSGAFRVARNAPMAMETRGVLAEPDARGGVHVISATQVPHLVREVLSEMLQLPQEQVRVQAVDVGGGFGAKTAVYPEEAVLPWLAMRLGRPVKWVADRLEDMATTIHGRGQVHQAEAAFDRDGRLLAVRDRYHVIGGAYNPQGILSCANSALHLFAPYRVAHRDIQVHQAYTNAAPLAPYRGSGRPEAVFVTERLMDMGARALGMDPAEVRRRNLVPPEAIPYDTGLTWRNGKPMVFDVGNFPACLAQALELSGYAEMRRQQAGAAASGRRIGIGVAFSVEGAAAGAFDAATVSVDTLGRIHVRSGGAPHGQGHETVLAQICADVWGVDVQQVTVAAGDTALIPFGRGTWGSGGAVHQGSSVYEAARQALQLARAAAALLLEADPADLEVAGGQVRVRGVPTRSISLANLARAMHPGHRSALNPELKTGLQATAYWRPPHGTFSYAADVAAVEVDAETGAVQLLDYVSVHDCGRVLNPMIVQGQVVGGIVQGMGQALWENAAYSSDGQLLAQTLMDYLIPTSADVCAIRSGHMETPTGRNPLGVMGMASGTCMNPPGAIVNAVEDALGGRVTLTSIPLRPGDLAQTDSW